MVVYSSVGVPGTEFIPLNGDPLPSCLEGTQPHVVGPNLFEDHPDDLTTLMRPAVVRDEGECSEAARGIMDPGFASTIKDLAHQGKRAGSGSICHEGPNLTLEPAPGADPGHLEAAERDFQTP